MKKLQILMSSYNGKRYLKEQIDSIMAQDCEEKGLASINLLVRDDGSSDGTQGVIKEYSDKYQGRVIWYQGSNKGVIQSFFELMAKAGPADYYALADQDDYWMPQKMSAGIMKLEHMQKRYGKGSNIPLLYCCRPLLADENLKPLDVHVDNPEMRPGFGNALIENIVTGCTTVFNGRLRQMAVLKIPEHATMHDRWMYLIATCFGEIYYDETPYIYYRQHGDNAVGKNTGRIPELKYRIKKFRNDSQKPGRQAMEFKHIFGREFKDASNNMEDLKEKEELLRLFIKGKRDKKARGKLARQGKIYRQRSLDDKIFKLLIRMNLY